MSSRKKYGLTGLSWHDIKRYPANLPVMILSVMGNAIAAGYLFRLASKHPEVTWRRTTNPEPWNDYSCKQYKFVTSGRDYTEGTPAPRYK